MTLLQRRPNDFAHRNLLLQVTLGLISAAKRFDALVEAHAPPEAPRREGEPALDDALYFVLGLVAFRARLMTAVEGIPLPPAPPLPPSPPDIDRELRDPRR